MPLGRHLRATSNVVAVAGVEATTIWLCQVKAESRSHAYSISQLSSAARLPSDRSIASVAISWTVRMCVKQHLQTGAQKPLCVARLGKWFACLKHAAIGWPG